MNRHFWSRIYDVRFDDRPTYKLLSEEDDEEEEEEMNKTKKNSSSKKKKKKKRVPAVRGDDDYYRMSIDRTRDDPRFVKPRNHLTSAEHLLKTECRSVPVTIVYGNLGRYPNMVTYYLDLCYGPDDRVVVSAGRAFWNRSHLDASYEDDGTKCDVLFVVEPKFGATVPVTPPPYADRMIVLSSHLVLDVPGNPAIVPFYAGPLLERKYPPTEGYVTWTGGGGGGGNDTHRPPRRVVYRPGLFVRRYDDMLAEEGWENYEEAGDRMSTAAPIENVCLDVLDAENVTEAYSRLANACDVMRHCDFAGNWTIALAEGLADSLKEGLSISRERFFQGRPRRSQRMDGIHDQYYIEPFIGKANGVLEMNVVVPPVVAT